MVTRPRSACWKPVMQSMVVLLPEPLGPMMPTILLASTVKETPSTARTPW